MTITAPPVIGTCPTIIAQIRKTVRDIIRDAHRAPPMRLKMLEAAWFEIIAYHDAHRLVTGVGDGEKLTFEGMPVDVVDYIENGQRYLVETMS